MVNAMFYQRVPLASLTQRNITVVNKFLDASATRYVDPNSDIAGQQGDLTFQTEGWATILIAIEGAPTNTRACVAETVLHIEGLPSNTSTVSTTPAAAFDTNTLQRVSRAAGNTPASYLQGEEASFINRAMGAMAEGATEQSLPFFRAAGRYAVNSAAIGLAGMMGYGIPGITNVNRPSAFGGRITN